MRYSTKSTPPYIYENGFLEEKNSPPVSQLMNALCFLIIHFIGVSPLCIWHNNYNIFHRIFKNIEIIFVIIIAAIFFSGCSKNQEDEKYNNLQARNYALNRELNEVVEKANKRATQLEAGISSLRSELARESSEKKKLESDMGVYQDIIDLLNKGEVDKAILLSKNITLSSVSELDKKIVEFIALSERLARLDEIKEKTNQLSDRNRIAVDILPRIGQIFIIAIIMVAISVLAISLFNLILSIQNRIERISAIALASMAIGFYISLYAVANRSVPSALFDIMTGVDSPSLKAIFNNKMFTFIVDYIAPIVAGYGAGWIIKKVILGNEYEQMAKTLSLILSIIMVFIMHAAIQYGINPKSGQLLIENIMFISSAVFTFSYTKVMHPPSSEERKETEKNEVS